VSLVTRDWRYRMVVPGRGEYQGVPMNLASKQFADAWNPATDEAAGKQCEAYGAAVVMLIPERLHISWQDEETLKVETDAGQQTRLLHFQPAADAASAPPSAQGYSQASWVIHPVPGGPPAGGIGGPFGGLRNGVRQPAGAAPAAPPPPQKPYGSIKVQTSNMLGGILRKNGLPYSDKATLLEYWEQQSDPITQTNYLLDTAALTDPTYLLRPYYYTATFKQESDGSKWKPTPCTLTAAP
jgi:hypothetical protein